MSEGGGLFIIEKAGTTDYWNELADYFDVIFSSQALYDYYDYEVRDYWINFIDSLNFGNHPIAEGPKL